MRPCFGMVDERRFIADATACVLPRSFEAVMFDKLACSLFFAPASLAASPDATLAAVTSTNLLPVAPGAPSLPD